MCCSFFVLPLSVGSHTRRPLFFTSFFSFYDARVSSFVFGWWVVTQAMGWGGVVGEKSEKGTRIEAHVELGTDRLFSIEKRIGDFKSDTIYWSLPRLWLPLTPAAPGVLILPPEVDIIVMGAPCWSGCWLIMARMRR